MDRRCMIEMNVDILLEKLPRNELPPCRSLIEWHQVKVHFHYHRLKVVLLYIASGDQMIINFCLCL